MLWVLSQLLLAVTFSLSVTSIVFTPGFIEMSKNEAPSESEMIKSCLNGLEKVKYRFTVVYFLQLGVFQYRDTVPLLQW